MIKVGSEYVWLWVIIEPKYKEILSITISKDKSILVVEKFLSKVVEKLRFPSGFTDDRGTRGILFKSVEFLKIHSHILSLFEKSNVIERTIIQYITDKTADREFR